MKIIDCVKTKYPDLTMNDLIELSCPDVLGDNPLFKPDWCDEVKPGTRVPQNEHYCEECWMREME